MAITRAKVELVVSWPRLVSYADGLANGIRSDQAIVLDGERMLRLGRSSLLPQGLTGSIPGAVWLQEAMDRVDERFAANGTA